MGHSGFTTSKRFAVVQLCPTLCDPMDFSMPGFPVLHYLSEFAQTHVHWVDDAIQWSHPPSPPALNLSQLQDLFQWVGSSQHVASVGASASALVLSLNIQIWFPCCPRDSQESSPAPQFKSIISLALSFLYSPILTSIHDYWKNHSFDQMDICWQSNVSAFEYAV